MKKLDGLPQMAAHALDQDPVRNARLLARSVTRLMDRKLCSTGLNSTQFSLLCLIASTPDDTVGTLAAMSGLDPSTMSRNLDVLARSGWVEAVLSESDRRRRAVWLTEAGLFKLAQAFPVWEAAQTVLTSGFSARELRDLAISVTALD